MYNYKKDNFSINQNIQFFHFRFNGRHYFLGAAILHLFISKLLYLMQKWILTSIYFYLFFNKYVNVVCFSAVINSFMAAILDFGGHFEWETENLILFGVAYVCITFMMSFMMVETVFCAPACYCCHTPRILGDAIFWEGRCMFSPITLLSYQIRRAIIQKYDLGIYSFQKNIDSLCPPKWYRWPYLAHTL